jgi:hypothetical protein
MARTIIGAVTPILLLAAVPAPACAPPIIPFASGSHRLNADDLATIAGARR